MGGSISDTATLLGGVTPTGTITFTLFGTADCLGTVLFSSTASVDGNGPGYDSAPFFPPAPGTYSWVAAYSGDGNNNVATTACGEAGEISTVTKASPTISTQAIASALMGGSISDTATLLGGVTPTGTITFTLFGTADCLGTVLFSSTASVDGNGPGYDSAPFFPPAPGTYSWVAAYSGDGNNNVATTACGEAGETSTVTKASPTISTQAIASALMGGSISDTATLLGGVTPTGTITFTLFGTADCLGTVLFSSTASVDGNGPGYDSAPFFPPAPGTYSWVAAYSGDGNNNVATTACGEAGETSTVTKASPTISTQAIASALMGGSISDTATLLGGVTPTGTITFTLFGTADCLGTVLFSSTASVDGNGPGYDSAPFFPPAPGTYSWVAAYSGDGNNNVATTACGEAGEISTVTKASPTISTQAIASALMGGSISDTATLLGGVTPTGTITFTLFGTADCLGTVLFSSTASVDGNGPGYDSAPFFPPAPGTYSWVAAYSGDGNNNVATTACGEAGETSTVTKASPTISTQAIASALMGGSISDTATLLGGVTPTGTITFTLFGTADCLGTVLFSSTASVDGNGPGYDSAPFFPPAPGTYSWVAAYSGDGNNNVATTACGEAGEISTVTKASPTISTQAIASALMGGSISDTATLLGGVTPTGTITFTLFGTADCLGTVLFSSTASVDGNGPGYDSAPFFPPAPGTYSWVAAYSGDGNNNVATTACGEAGETSTVTKASPTISTQAIASALMGGSISDTATLLGGVTPTGTITFTLFGTADCLGTVLFNSTNGVSPAGINFSDPYTPLAPGTYRWIAAYRGDANNNSATTLCNDPNEISVVTKASPAISTEATVSAVMGGTISDTAILSGGSGATGTITYVVFGPNDATCTGTSIFTSTKTVIGDGVYTSDSYTPVSPGIYSWVATYSGDTNNNRATSLCNDNGETSTVTNKTTPTISTQATASADPGSAISDVALLSVGNAPTGTIIFNLFGPSDTSCAGTSIFTSSKTVTHNGTYPSDSFTPASPGTYRWIASYGGDANNNGATTLCNDPGETSTVTTNEASPTIRTEATASANPGGIISDTAILAAGNSPSGTIIFNLFGPSDTSCTGTSIFTSSKTVTGNGTYPSESFSPSSPGTYRWIASYGGDAKNNAAATLCNDAGETSTVSNKSTPTISTRATASANPGGIISDTAILAAANSPTGTIIFNLFGPGDANCSGTRIFTSSETVTGNGTYPSDSFVPALPGTYSWIASYSGDASNNAAATLCNDPSETSTVTKANPAITTQASASANTGGTISDSATLSGGYRPTGAITFNLFGPNNANCSGTPIFTSSKTVNGNSAYPSAPFTPVMPGAYRWIASYSGDPTNNAATTACNDAGETSAVTRVIAPDVKLTMFSVGGFSTGHIGAYIVIITNTGTVPTSGTLTFTDTLPAGLTYAGSFTFGWNCSVAGQTITCTYAHPLPVGGITAFAIFVNVTAAGGTVLTNTGTLNPSDATPADNTASVTDNVRHSRRFDNIDSQSGPNGRDDSSQSASSEGPSRGRD